MAPRTAQRGLPCVLVAPVHAPPHLVGAVGQTLVIEHVVEEDDVARIEFDGHGLVHVGRQVLLRYLEVEFAVFVPRHADPVGAGNELHAAVVLAGRDQRRPYVDHAQGIHRLRAVVPVSVDLVGIPAVLVPEDERGGVIGQLGTDGIVGIETKFLAHQGFHDIEQGRVEEHVVHTRQVEFLAKYVGRLVRGILTEPGQARLKRCLGMIPGDLARRHKPFREPFDELGRGVPGRRYDRVGIESLQNQKSRGFVSVQVRVRFHRHFNVSGLNARPLIRRSAGLPPMAASPRQATRLPKHPYEYTCTRFDPFNLPRVAVVSSVCALPPSEYTRSARSRYAIHPSPRH